MCGTGKWNGSKWKGPPRHYLKAKFEDWTKNLNLCLDVSDLQNDRVIERYELQQDGGFQNTYIFGHRRSLGVIDMPL